ncbi:hypothetical protein N9T26_01865, partial [Alphaproteobacteria bacterium]|nr:hypothetical protein [Alphaproteobacteria bacterium]
MQSKADFLVHLSRQTKVLIQIFLDCFSLGLTLAMLLILDSSTAPTFNLKTYVLCLMSGSFAIVITHFVVGTFKSPIRYFQPVLWVKLSGVAVLVTLALFSTLMNTNLIPTSFQWGFFMIAFFLLMMSWRSASWAIFFSTNQVMATDNVALFGVNSNSRQLLSMVKASTNFQATYFIENSENLEGVEVDGLKVISLDKFINKIEDHKTSLVLIDSEKMASPTIADILSTLHNTSIKLKTIPSLSELIVKENKSLDLQNLQI